MDKITEQKRINPFFEDYGTPHYTIPFPKIKTSDYEEAFMEGIRRDDELIEKMVNDPSTPTFENTLARVDVEKGERYYDLLDRVSTVFYMTIPIANLRLKSRCYSTKVTTALLGVEHS